MRQLKASNDKIEVLLGQVTSIQKNKKPLKEANVGDEICIKHNKPEYGQDFDYIYKLSTYYKETDKYIMDKYKDIFT